MSECVDSDFNSSASVAVRLLQCVCCSASVEVPLLQLPQQLGRCILFSRNIALTSVAMPLQPLQSLLQLLQRFVASQPEPPVQPCRVK
jgi:hypothetical protein